MILGLWLLGPVLLIVELVAVASLSGFPFLEKLPEVAVLILRASLYPALWTAYLLRSERVEITYDRHPEVLAEALA
ncbi:hypothetical protein D3876_07485 [Sphingomonas cavernae]|uniref:Uncharacterized protein n=1 Tax=Sphingomonas cavernae TaxID=2320861 RepID=A0A418WS57_9SPHN|nr:hypothetical protein D3876_07485 [Sphingomonas cavernae]